MGLNYLIFGLRSVWFHATNVALHAAATVLFTRVCLTVAGLRRNFAILAGILFAVHPIHTEARHRTVAFLPLAIVALNTKHLDFGAMQGTLRSGDTHYNFRAGAARMPLDKSYAKPGQPSASCSKMAEVTGIVGRADVLACIFFLISLLVYHGEAAKGAEEKQNHKRSIYEMNPKRASNDHDVASAGLETTNTCHRDRNIGLFGDGN
uniref:Uncharacterized protein n=1 Tax=Anopheles albimanus TaxID=7167 RepID=A0A182FV67_ANOAL